MGQSLVGFHREERSQRNNMFPISLLFLIGFICSSLAFSVVEGGKSCSTLSRCVPIYSCPALLNLVAQVKMGDKEALGKLLASQCGFTRQLPMVCCPLRSKKRPKAALPPPTPPQRRPQPTQTPQAPQPTQTSFRPRPLPLEPRAQDFSKLNHLKCGTRTALNFRVTLGRSAGQGQFPWVAALIYTRGQLALPLCGATLISRSHLLTAAHCTANLGGFRLARAKLGQTDLSDKSGVQVGIRRVLRHPQFQQDPLAVFDIAIVQLRTSLRFSDQIRPICLWSPSIERTNDELVVAGWGRTQAVERSNVLQVLDLEEVPATQCKAEYQPLGVHLLESQMCARGGGGSDSCTGDSGGPLMARKGNTWQLEGIVSYGTQGCDSSLPGVYTRISSFLPWLNSALSLL